MAHISLSEINNIKHRVTDLRCEVGHAIRNLQETAEHLQKLEEHIMSFAISATVHNNSNEGD